MAGRPPRPPIAACLLAVLSLGACAPDPGAGAGASGPGIGTYPALPDRFERGVNLEPIRGFGRTLDLDSLPSTLDELVAMGVDHVAIVPSFFQARLGESSFEWRGGRDAVERETRTAIRAAHAAGLGVLLKPHLWLEDRGDGAWRGDIDPDEAAWPAWSGAYRDAILGFARLGAQESVEAISIGSELRDLTRSRPGFWRGLAADVRDLYPGRVTYAANWHEEFDGIEFWDALDAIGVDAFFPLTDDADEALTTGRCQERMGAVRDALHAVAARTGRPVMLTEIGYKSARGGLWQPWEWQGSEPDPDAQAAAWDCVASVLGAVASAAPGTDGGWLTGLYVWDWPVGGRAGGRLDTGFTPRGKPAEAILRAWFRGAGAAGPGTPRN